MILNINSARTVLWKCNLDPNTNDRTNTTNIRMKKLEEFMAEHKINDAGILQ
jgi:hypothetical protein